MEKNNIAFANFVLKKLSTENMDLVTSMEKEFENLEDKTEYNIENETAGTAGQADFKEQVNQMTKILMELADCKKSNKELQEKIGKSSEEMMNLKLEFKEIMEKNEIKLEEEKFALMLKVMRSICPAMDTFNMAKMSCGNDKNMLYGIEMIEKQILDSFSFFGVNKLELQIGDEFDEKNCEALELVAGDRDNEIKKIITYPLFFKGKLLIPGKVFVSKKS